jgi:archaellum component FlaC
MEFSIESEIDKMVNYFENANFHISERLDELQGDASYAQSETQDINCNIDTINEKITALLNHLGLRGYF